MKTVMLFLLAISTLGAQMPSMKGIDKVNVWIDFASVGGTGECADLSLPKSFSLTEGIVRTDIELQLRKAGIAVTNDPAFVWVHLFVTGCAMAHSSVFTVLLTLEESATVARGKQGLVITWRDLSSQINTPDPRVMIQDCMSRLINHWLADNPVTRPKAAL